MSATKAPNPDSQSCTSYRIAMIATRCSVSVARSRHPPQHAAVPTRARGEVGGTRAFDVTVVRGEARVSSLGSSTWHCASASDS